MGRTLKSFVPALLWLIVITLLSTTPGKDLPPIQLISADKFAHAAVYALLFWLSAQALRTHQSQPLSALTLFYLLIAVALYGVLMEFVQYLFIPGRFYEYADMLANLLGALLAMAVYYWWQKRRV